MNAALYYHPEAYSISGPRLMGRNAAGESFLRGYLAYSQASEYWIQIQNAEHLEHFRQTLQAASIDTPVNAVTRSTIGQLAQAGVVYYPGPGLSEHAWQRASFGHPSWSLCGITHTTSSAIAMDALAELLTAPIQPWDALICTSTAVKNNVSRLLQTQADYLQNRLGITRLVLPQLPVIPLGIHTQDFSFTAEQKNAAREKLGLAGKSEALVVLFMGRLSFHAKAHPLAMYQALENAAHETGKEVVLVECGWHATDFIRDAYVAGAALACPNVRVVVLDGRKAEDRQTAWAGADIFCSLSDNIQETFGIVPLEAMAAGMPVVVADWDGYKDTVRDGVDGYRIPTTMPGAGLGNDLALRHALGLDTYDMYCGHASSLVAVDIDVATTAFAGLFTAPGLRRQMGAAGRERARSLYDWKVIIPQYQALWAELTKLREANTAQTKPLAHPWPARMDPLHAFGAYPSQIIGPETLFELVDSDAESANARLASYRGLTMVDYARVVLPTEAETRIVLKNAGRNHEPVAAKDLLAGISDKRHPFVFRGLAWLLKLGILRIRA